MIGGFTMKKWMSAVLCLLLVLGTLCIGAGCGGPSYDNPGDDYEVDLDVDAQITETLTVGLYLQTEQDKKHFQELEKAFKVRYANVNIEIQNFSGSSYYSELMKAYNAGTMPDLFMVNSAMSFVGIELGLLLNLNPYIQAETQRNPQYEEQFVRSMWKLGQKNYDGAQYFVPRSADRIVMHYNKKIFNDAGVDMKLVKNGWSWEDFLTVCETLSDYYRKNKNGVPFLNAGIDWEATIFPVMESLGAQVFDDKGNLNMDTPEMKAFLKHFRDLVDKGYIAASNQTPADLVSGNAAMVFHSNPADYYISALDKDYDLVTFPLIGADKSKSKIGAGIAGYGIFSGISESKRDLAWRFLDFTLSKDGQNAMARAGVTVPPIRTDMQNPDLNLWGKGKESLNMEAYIWEPERNFATNFYLHCDPGDQSALCDAIYDMLSDHLFDKGYKDADTVIRECKQAITQIINF